MSDNLFIVFSDSVISRHQFDDLMRDIGIVNETVMDNLWAHVELTVEKDKMSDDEAESMNHKMKKIEAENRSLRVQLAAVSEKMKAIQAIVTSISAAIAHAGDIPAHKPHSETERLLAVPPEDLSEKRVPRWQCWSCIYPGRKDEKYENGYKGAPIAP